MRLVLDPAEDVAHGAWLRDVPGAYEWWYFDALSDDSVWALTCIWFLGNPFSPYYRLAALGCRPDPYQHNALFFALYKAGRLHAYHFTRFPRSLICADEHRPATLRFSDNELSLSNGTYRLHLADENANRRTLRAQLSFQAPPLVGEGIVSLGDGHSWLPAAPACQVAGRIILSELHNTGTEEIAFLGQGYHDHNWGTLPFGADVRDWYWARASLGAGQAAILYHVGYHHTVPVSHLLIFDKGRLVQHDDRAQVTLGRRCINGLGTVYATRLTASSGDVTAEFRMGERLDSAPFYVRTLCSAEVIRAGQTMRGQGIGEYFRPGMMAWPLVASAMKARIVEI